ncbi:MAG: hypothetical protein AAGA64_07015 [Bacteroidota bacterium]
MCENLYYGEIAAKISAQLYSNECISDLDEDIRYSHDDEHLFDICSNSAKAFSAMQDLAGDVDIQWRDALDEYTSDIMEQLQTNDNLDIIDMVKIASNSVQNTR